MSLKDPHLEAHAKTWEETFFGGQKILFQNIKENIHE